MHLEFLIPTHISPDKGAIHYRRAGEQLPLCGQLRNSWEVITIKERVAKYFWYHICLECVEKKHRLEHNNSV